MLREPVTLSLSIVVYRPDEVLLNRTIETLTTALLRVSGDVSHTTLYLVDNGESTETRAYGVARSPLFAYCVISGHGNVGYGRGHNLALDRAMSDFHIILNPDVELDPDSLREALAFFEAEPAVGLLAPAVRAPDNERQYLCRRVPTVLDLFVRGFLPLCARRLFAHRLARYEMHDVLAASQIVWDPPIISGCFMMFRTTALKKLGGFDARYFLYFEDYDLSLRAHDVTRVAYVPAVRIVHHGGGASRKGAAHVRMFAASAFRFFNRFGWRWW